MPKHDAISILEHDHQQVRTLFSELQESKEDREQLELTLEELAMAIQSHTTLEEEIFYPTFREAVRGQEEERLYFESLEEHGLIDLLLPEVQQGQRGTPEFLAKCKVLLDLLEHHMQTEERELFPLVRKVMSAEQLDELMEALEERKDELMGGVEETMEEAEAGVEVAGDDGKIDLNSASVDDLSGISGIDEKRAEKLVSYRDSHGGRFDSWDDVRAVEGFDAAMLRKLQQEATLRH